jgi:hypothetical protein
VETIVDKEALLRIAVAIAIRVAAPCADIIRRDLCLVVPARHCCMLSELTRGITALSELFAGDERQQVED